jgi:mono/diheme cytochrome c family protein
VLLDTGVVAFSLCAGCHMQKGVGSPGFAPPLGQADFFMAERLRPVRIVLLGMPNVIDTQTFITVNGLEYNGGDNQMSAEALHAGWSNLKIAGVLTYIRAVLNDSTSTNCDPDNLDENQMATCTRTPRPVSEVESDSIAVWEVKAIRDSLAGEGLIPVSP